MDTLKPNGIDWTPMTEADLAHMAGLSAHSDLMRSEPNNFGPSVADAYDALKSLAENDISVKDIIPAL